MDEDTLPKIQVNQICIDCEDRGESTDPVKVAAHMPLRGSESEWEQPEQPAPADKSCRAAGRQKLRHLASMECPTRTYVAMDNCSISN